MEKCQWSCDKCRQFEADEKRVEELNAVSRVLCLPCSHGYLPMIKELPNGKVMISSNNVFAENSDRRCCGEYTTSDIGLAISEWNKAARNLPNA